jgi:hypothetical protein
MKTIKRDFNSEVGTTLADIIARHSDEELTIRELATLATPELDSEMLDGLRSEAVVHFIHRIMRSAKFKGEHGERIRNFHSYKKFFQTDDGQEKQLDIWRTIETMTPAQMLLSAKARLGQSKRIVASVAADVRWWDQNVAAKIHAEPLMPQLGLNGE